MIVNNFFTPLIYNNAHKYFTTCQTLLNSVLLQVCNCHDPASRGRVSVHSGGRENAQAGVQGSGGQLQEVAADAATELYARNVAQYVLTIHWLS